MTVEGFRRLALSLPEASEVGHMGHPDFRMGGKIFTRDFIRIGRVSYWGDTRRTRAELVPRLEHPTLGDGLHTLK